MSNPSGVGRADAKVGNQVSLEIRRVAVWDGEGGARAIGCRYGHVCIVVKGEPPCSKRTRGTVKVRPTAKGLAIGTVDLVSEVASSGAIRVGGDGKVGHMGRIPIHRAAV